MNRNLNIAHHLNHKLETPLPVTAVKKHLLNHRLLVEVLPSLFWIRKLQEHSTFLTPAYAPFIST